VVPAPLAPLLSLEVVCVRNAMLRAEGECGEVEPAEGPLDRTMAPREFGLPFSSLESGLVFEVCVCVCDVCEMCACVCVCVCVIYVYFIYLHIYLFGMLAR